jgi:opacity protein-like surface antigen
MGPRNVQELGEDTVLKPSLRLLLALALPGVSCFAQDFNKWTVEGAAGPTFPSGGAKDRWNTGWNFMLGGGRNFTPHISGVIEFQYDRFGLTNTALQNYSQPDGYNRFWSFTFNPRYDFNPKGRFDGYLTGGYGVYSRTLAFTDPSQIQQYCDPYYGYCQSSGAPVIASYINYRGGVNAGGGVTHTLFGSGLKFFTDVRFNRFLGHTPNDFVTLRFGILY